MPTKIEKDAVTGQETTGHEWDGIKELNTPLPKWWLYTLYATIVWAAVYVVLYPAIPYWTGYTKGILGWSSRDLLDERMAAAAERQGFYLQGIREASLDEIRSDDALFAFARSGGAAAFADNCAPCHAAGGAGQPGRFPALVDDAWIWGGSAEEIEHTIRYGVRWDLPESRASEMPAFGTFLSRSEIADAAEYVLLLSGQEHDTTAAARGEEIFAENCTACHGDGGEGLRELGAPALNNQIWLYGGDKAAIAAQIARPQHGVMPAWEGRLPNETIKMLTIYVHSLGGGE